jgi:hypothetical protein
MPVATAAIGTLKRKPRKGSKATALPVATAWEIVQAIVNGTFVYQLIRTGAAGPRIITQGERCHCASTLYALASWTV